MKWPANLLALAVCAALIGSSGCGEKPAAKPAAARTVTPIDPAKTGAIGGECTFTGPAATPKALKMGGTPECVAMHHEPPHSEDLLVKDGKLQNVFVYVKEGLEKMVFAIPQKPATLDQRGCVFGPHVLGVQVGQAIEMLNNDPTLHNLHTFPKSSDSWNIGFPGKGVTQTRTIDAPEIGIEYRCDVHGWMKGYLHAVDHPFFQVTGEDGRFNLVGIPAGDYTLEAWHETLGAQTAKVHVDAKQTKPVSFAFAPR